MMFKNKREAYAAGYVVHYGRRGFFLEFVARSTSRPDFRGTEHKTLRAALDQLGEQLGSPDRVWPDARHDDIPLAVDWAIANGRQPAAA